MAKKFSISADGKYSSNIQHLRTMQSLTRSLTAVALLSCCVLSGCHAAPPVTRDILVGSYVYKSDDPEERVTDHNLDHLILKADGTYALVQGGTTKQRVETDGLWTLWQGGSDGPRVLLDHSGYPIQLKKNKVRLLVDTDVGIWYEK